jgi:hypothetical protein
MQNVCIASRFLCSELRNPVDLGLCFRGFLFSGGVGASRRSRSLFASTPVMAVRRPTIVKPSLPPPSLSAVGAPMLLVTPHRSTGVGGFALDTHSGETATPKAASNRFSTQHVRLLDSGEPADSQHQPFPARPQSSSARRFSGPTARPNTSAGSHADVVLHNAAQQVSQLRVEPVARPDRAVRFAEHAVFHSGSSEPRTNPPPQPAQPLQQPSSRSYAEQGAGPTAVHHRSKPASRLYALPARGMDEESVAARKIQRWFRAHLRRKQAAREAVRQMIASKRAELGQQQRVTQQQALIDTMRRVDTQSEHRKLREKQAHRERQEAIEAMKSQRAQRATPTSESDADHARRTRQELGQQQTSEPTGDSRRDPAQARHDPGQPLEESESDINQQEEDFEEVKVQRAGVARSGLVPSGASVANRPRTAPVPHVGRVSHLEEAQKSSQGRVASADVRTVSSAQAANPRATEPVVGGEAPRRAADLGPPLPTRPDTTSAAYKPASHGRSSDPPAVTKQPNDPHTQYSLTSSQRAPAATVKHVVASDTESGTGVERFAPPPLSQQHAATQADPDGAIEGSLEHEGEDTSRQQDDAQRAQAAGPKENLLAFLQEVDRHHEPVPSEFAIVKQARARAAGAAAPTSAAPATMAVGSRSSAGANEVKQSQTNQQRPGRQGSGPAVASAGASAAATAAAARHAASRATGKDSATSGASRRRESLGEIAGGASSELQAALAAQSAEVERLLEARATQQAVATQAMREEYESVIARHLSFIDQLIHDKKELAEKCERLVGELQSLDSTYSTRLKAMEDRHRHEMKKQKDVSVKCGCV